MKKLVVTAAALAAIVAIVAIPAVVNASTPKKAVHAKVAAATKYECVKCHMIYSAADAKKDKYRCEMDGGKLAPVKPAVKTGAK